MDSIRIWLVQTGIWRKEKCEDELTLEKYIDLTYMGAAEYEMEFDSNSGKLRNPLYLSLERIFLDKENYEFYPLPKRKDAYGNQLYLYCKKDMVEELKPFVRKLLDGKIKTKNGPSVSYVKASIEDIEKYPKMKNFWWDIKNDYFIFYGEDKFEKINDSLDSFFEENKEKLLPKIKKQKKSSIIKRFLEKFIDLLRLKGED